MRGRKPKPTHLKLVEGNPGKRPLNEREPKPKATGLSPPAQLGADAAREWRRLATQLSVLRVLTTADRQTFAAYCDAYGRWAEASRAMKGAELVISTSNGNLVQNPLLGIIRRAAADMVRFGAEFGLTPSSRSRVEVAPPDKADDGAAEFGL